MENSARSVCVYIWSTCKCRTVHNGCFPWALKKPQPCQLVWAPVFRSSGALSHLFAGGLLNSQWNECTVIAGQYYWLQDPLSESTESHLLFSAMLGEKEFKKVELTLWAHGAPFACHRRHWWTYLTQTSHSSLAQALFSVGMMRECDDCCFPSYRHDQCVSGLIESTGILESDESPGPFIRVLAYVAFPLHTAHLIPFFDPLVVGKFLYYYFKTGWLTFHTRPWSVLCSFLPGWAQLDSFKIEDFISISRISSF